MLSFGTRSNLLSSIAFLQQIGVWSGHITHTYVLNWSAQHLDSERDFDALNGISIMIQVQTDGFFRQSARTGIHSILPHSVSGAGSRTIERPLKRLDK